MAARVFPKHTWNYGTSLQIDDRYSPISLQKCSKFPSPTGLGIIVPNTEGRFLIRLNRLRSLISVFQVPLSWRSKSPLWLIREVQSFLSEVQVTRSVPCAVGFVTFRSRGMPTPSLSFRLWRSPVATCLKFRHFTPTPQPTLPQFLLCSKTVPDILSGYLWI